MEEVPGVGDFSDGSMFFKKPSCEVVGGVFVFVAGAANGFEVASVVEIFNAGLIGQGNLRVCLSHRRCSLRYVRWQGFR